METKEQLDKMPEVIDDETGALTVSELKKILVTDITKYEKHLSQLEKDRANYVEQLDVDMKIWEILKNPETYKKKKEHCMFEYEDDEEYWSLVHKKQLYKIRQEEMRCLGTLEQMDFEKEQIEADMVDKKEKLAKLEGDEE